MQNIMKERRQNNLLNLLLAFIMLSTGRGTYIHIHIELSSLMYNFLAANDNNSLRVIVTGKRVGEVGLVVPAAIAYSIHGHICHILEVNSKRPVFLNLFIKYFQSLVVPKIYNSIT